MTNAHDWCEDAGQHVREEERKRLVQRLYSTKALSHLDPRFFFGRGYQGPTDVAPPCVWESSQTPREDHATPQWLTASEFSDSPDVAARKIAQLANLMRLSKHTVVYSGAGISASVIGQAARSGTNTQGWLKRGSLREARPTPTHYALGALGRAGIVHGWVQQNHDGLPQKAGFPQERINEIHGSWYDPANPVVKYNGSLKDAEYDWLEREIRSADLVIALGTSLGGLNADRLVSETAARSMQRPRRGGGALGSVIINLQQTPEDGDATLRLFGRTDDMLPPLLTALGVAAVAAVPPTWPRESCALVPYSADGMRLAAGAAGVAPSDMTWLDLRDGARVRITSGHNIQGAKQPSFMHIGAPPAVTGVVGQNGVLRRSAPGVGKVVRRDEASESFILEIEGTQMHLGIWWLEAAARGGPAQLPVTNVQEERQAAEEAVESAAVLRPSALTAVREAELSAEWDAWAEQVADEKASDAKVAQGKQQLAKQWFGALHPTEQAFVKQLKQLKDKVKENAAVAKGAQRTRHSSDSAW